MSQWANKLTQSSSVDYMNLVSAVQDVFFSVVKLCSLCNVTGHKTLQVNVIVDQDGCNANADINFLLTGYGPCRQISQFLFFNCQKKASWLFLSIKPDNTSYFFLFYFCRFTLSGRLIGAVGGESCPIKDGGPSGVKVELLSISDDLIASSLTSAIGGYSFTNIIPGLTSLLFLCLFTLTSE